MKWIIIIVVALIALIALAYLIGYFMPVRHKASMTVKLNATPQRTWSIVRSPQEFMTWRSGLKNVISTDSTHWTEISGNGTIHYEVEIMHPNETFVSRIMNRDLPFGGSWTFELKPADQQTQLTITEDGEVYNPIFRFMSKYVFGHEASLRQYATDLDKYINKK